MKHVKKVNLLYLSFDIWSHIHSLFQFIKEGVSNIHGKKQYILVHNSCRILYCYIPIYLGGYLYIISTS